MADQQNKNLKTPAQPKQQVTTLRTAVDLSGKTALVIGATAGIGRAIAEQLARAGATTIVAGRDATKLDKVAAELEAFAPGRIRTQSIDLADLASIKQAAAQLSATYPTLDIVIANASTTALSKQRTFTRDGFETTFGVNHIGNAALLLGLERPIRAANAARVVILASESHRRAGGLPLDDLMGERNFGGTRAYSRSKLANILFARELAKRWIGTTIYAAHPGMVLTDMFRKMVAQNLLFRAIFRLIKSTLLSPDQAAAGLVRIAVDPDLAAASGTYFELGRPDVPSLLADDAELGRRLYDYTLALIDNPQAKPAQPVYRAPALSLQARLLLRIIPLASSTFRNVAKLDEAIRANRAKGVALPPAQIQREFAFSEEAWEQIRVLRLAAPNVASQPLKILYLHGGAFVFKLQSMQWGLPVGLLKRLGGEVFTPMYPLAPEHDWRAGQDAVRRVYLQLVAAYGAENIVVIGDSAGGGLALSLALSLRASGSPQPAALLLFSPWLDLAMKGEDQPAIQRHDPALSIDFLRAAGKLWGRDVAADDPRVSPLFGDLSELPPTLVFSGTRDILDSDAVRLAACNPAVTMRRAPGMFHVWASAPIPEGRRALDEAAAFISAVL